MTADDNGVIEQRKNIWTKSIIMFHPWLAIFKAMISKYELILLKFSFVDSLYCSCA